MHVYEPTVAFATIETGAQYAILNLKNTTRTLNIGADNAGLFFDVGTTGQIVSYVGGTEAMRILSNGTVAIGSTTRANVWGLLTLRNTLNSSTQRWGIGPDTNNSLTVYNPSNVGVYITDGGTSWTANSDINLKNIEEKIAELKK